MKHEFISYEQALALKELGFDEPCLAYLIGFGDGTKENGRYKINQQQMFYPNDTSPDDKAEELGLHPFVMCGVPLFQQAFRWFREKYNLHHVITIANLGKFEEGNPDFQCAIYSKNPVLITNMNECNSYEEAELTCLKKLIEIVRA
jgi:hypothetical protein